MSSIIKTEVLKNINLSSYIVTDVLTTNEIKKDDFRLVESGAVYDKLQELEQLLSGYGSDSFSLYKKKSYSNLFSFDDNLTGSITIGGNIPEKYQFVKVNNNTPVELNSSNYLSSKYFRIPSAIKTNDGRLIAVYDIRWQNEQDITRTTYNDQMIGMSYSDDDGETWSQPKRIISWFMSSSDENDTYYQSGASDPGIIYDSIHNVIMVFAVAGKGFAYKSTPYLWSKTGSAIDSAERQQFVLAWSKDNGETWSEPVSINNKIFDNENFNSHNWINDYTYLFSSCGTGITLKNQQIEENNGQILLLAQLHVTPSSSLPSDFDEFQKPSRAQILKIIPTYSTTNNLQDIKCVLVGSSIGEINNGSDEGQICEGPNGELVAIVKSYGEFNNSEYGSFSNSCIRIRIYKSTDLGETWQICGDLTNDTNDSICTTLESTAATKPSIYYSEKLGVYIASYQLSFGKDTRVYHILRYSKDLISWQVFDTLLPFSTSGYASFVQQNDNNQLGIIFEGYSGGTWSGSSFTWTAAKQISYCKYNLTGTEETTKTNYVSEVGALASGTAKNVQGFSFTLNNFTSKSSLSVDALKIQCTPALTSDFYCILYESNMPTALSVAQTLSCSQVSCDTQLSDINMFYTFPLDKSVELQNNFKEYFVRFVRNGTSLSQDGTRGTLPTTQNDGIILPTLLSKKSSSGMNVYVGGQIQCVPSNIQIATNINQSYPTHILVGFKEV